MSYKTISGMRPRLLLSLALTSLCFAQLHVLQKSNTAENLRGVSAVSTKVAWASGTHGTYLRTIDGGSSWTPATVPGAEGLDFRDVEAFSADEAYLLAAGPGDQSRIYKTSDAGKSWALQFENRDPKGFYDCLAFWDRTHGIALGDPVNGAFELLTTEDGVNWKALTPTSLPPAMEGEGAFAASGTCISTQGRSNAWFATGGKVARVFHSGDRCRTWTVTETPILHGNDSSGIFSIAFYDANHGLIAGGDYQHPEQGGANLAYTEDGGGSWKLVDIQPQWYLSAIGYVDSSVPGGLLAVGSARAGFTNNIRRKKWRVVLEANLNAVSVVAPFTAWAVGPKGTIMYWSLGHRNRAGVNH
jgi:photosystem II stability/assembly factor-like uncharacterized protein